MSAPLDSLMRYVRSGTTEGDLPFIADAFVSPSQIADLYGIEPGSMRVLVGNKGVGKSAMVEWLKKNSVRSKLPCVLIRPDNFIDTGAPESLDSSSLKSYYYDKILRTTAIEVGKQIHSYLPLRGEAAKLYNEARRAGLSKDDLITKSLDLLSTIALPIRNIDGTALAKSIAGTNAHETLVRSINLHLLKEASKVIFFLIDDTDQLAKPSEPEQLNKIWALILAVRRLTMECPSVRPILTLRSSVWSRLMNEDSGQRDQADHIRPLVISLIATDQLIIDIVEKRLSQAARDSEQNAANPYDPFFESFSMTLPTSDERRSWPSFISKSSRERPRDALQLIKIMIEFARNSHRQKISDKDASEAMQKYSDERVTDISNEYSLDCEAIREVIGSFYVCDFELDFEILRKHLHSTLGMVIPPFSAVAKSGAMRHEPIAASA